ncbi:MAG: 6,7-dimethyl-8-ribityllumazine synthase [Deltaproteobacteria bacterium]|nr:6,7-dimethyl-8-ribityllumazine synthase [Deltaproteobacteria bacterium]
MSAGRVTNQIHGAITCSNSSFAIVASRFNGQVTQLLVDGAIDAIIRHGGSEGGVTVVRVPGSFEIPVTVRKLALLGKFDAIIALGTLIEGETDHYRLICDEVASGLMQVSLETLTPVTFGVLTVKNSEHARERAGGKAGNKGWEAAVAAIEMVNVLSQVEKLTVS